MYPLTGIELASGVARLSQTCTRIDWNRNGLLAASCDSVAPAFRVSPTPDQNALFSLSLKHPHRDGRTRLQASDIAPTKQLLTQLGNKAELDWILAESDLPRIRHEVLSLADADPSALWDRFEGAPLVVQLLNDGTCGSGTRSCRDIEEVGAVSRQWSKGQVKVSQYLSGRNLSFAGCVQRRHVLTSPISQQLVGTPELTIHWGAHNGNQLLGSQDLSESTAAACLSACEAVGNTLRRHGFVGAFGLDCIEHRQGDVYVVEINPRLITLTSLLNHSLIECGFLPFPLAQILTFLDDDGADLAVRPFNPTQSLGQLVLFSRRDVRIVDAPESACYRLDGEDLRKASSTPVLADLQEPSDALVWTLVRAGQDVQAHTPLAVIQARAVLGVPDRRGALTETGGRLSTSLKNAFTVDPPDGI